MNAELISTVMALYKEGFLSNEDVITWADNMILEDAEPLDYLTELSLKGPEICGDYSSAEFPPAKVLTYSERFALRVTTLDTQSEDECEKFRMWVASASLGEDLKKPEVLFGYWIDEDFYCGDNREGGMKLFNEELPKLIDQTEKLAESLWSKISVLKNHWMQIRSDYRPRPYVELDKPNSEYNELLRHSR